jgi:hypothetical protein
MGLREMEWECVCGLDSSAPLSCLSLVSAVSIKGGEFILYLSDC